MCGGAACACKASRLAHLSTTTKVSSPNLAGWLPASAQSTVAVYSMQPASACTAGTFARKASSTLSRVPGFAVMIAST